MIASQGTYPRPVGAAGQDNGGVGMESQALSSHAVQVWCTDVGMSLYSQIPIALVVGQDNNEVGQIGRLACLKQGNQNQDKLAAKEHGSFIVAQWQVWCRPWRLQRSLIQNHHHSGLFCIAWSSFCNAAEAMTATGESGCKESNSLSS